jgi:murein DD-endopeptidase
VNQTHWRLAIGASLCFALLTGCATTPSAVPPQVETNEGIPLSRQTVGEQIAERALQQVGRPYRYGGSGPDSFDCSGLVHFTFGAAGIDTPRATSQQYRLATAVSLADIAPGDLLFFRIDNKRVSHVAIYVGDGRFVHAPQTGRSVETRNVDDEYYRSRMAGVGRFR